jgi:hypothetical protein
MGAMDREEGWRRFGGHLKDRREKHFQLKLTAVEILTQGDIKAGTLRKVEAGRSGTSDLTLYKLAKFFRWPEDYPRSVLDGGPLLDIHWEPEPAEEPDPELRQRVKDMERELSDSKKTTQQVTQRMRSLENELKRLRNQLGSQPDDPGSGPSGA